MVCSNCKSTDIATIQGQNFCLNCGRPVVSGSTALASPLKLSVTQPPVARPVTNMDAMHAATAEQSVQAAARTQASAVAVKLKTASPPSLEPALPAPASVTSQPTIIRRSIKPTAETAASSAPIAVAASTPGIPSIKIIKKEAGERLNAGVANLTVSAASGQTAGQPGRSAKQSVAVRRISDIKPLEPRPQPRAPRAAAAVEQVERIDQKSNVEKVTITPTRQSSSGLAPAKLPKMKFGDALRSALASIGLAKGKRYGYLAAIYLALPLAFAARWLVAIQPSTSPSFSVGYIFQLWHAAAAHIPSFNKQMILLSGAALFYVLLADVTKLWAASALGYGHSKELDNRALARKLWSAAGWNSLWSASGNALIGLLSVGLTLGLAMVADQQFGIVFGSPSWIYLGVRVVVWLFALVMFNRLLEKTVLAHHAIVVGGLGALAARKQAARLGSAVGGKTFLALIINLVVAKVFMIVGLLAVGIGMWLMQGFGNAALHGWSIFALSLVVWIITIHAVLVFSVVFWLGIYRWAITRSKLAVASTLHNGRLPATRSVTAAMLIVLLGGVLITLATYTAYSHSDSIDHWYRQNIQTIS